MEELDILGNLGKLLGLAPDENYLPLLLVLPLFISMATEFLKRLIANIKKQENLSADLKTNIQIIISFLVAILVLYILYGTNVQIKDVLGKSIYFTIILAKLSSYCYKGIPIVNAIPGLKDIKLQTLFKQIDKVATEHAQNVVLKEEAKITGGYG